MTMFHTTRWLSGIKAIAAISAIALSFPAAAVAQTNATDTNFSNDLYNFLQDQNAISHYMAVGIESQIGLTNAEIAQSMCVEMAAGGSVQDLYAAFMSGVEMGASNVHQADYAELEYAAQLYFGSVLNLGSAYYCPGYQAEVVRALQTL